MNDHLERAEVLAGEELYRIVKDLGQGAFGFVRLGINRRTNERVAIKYISRGKSINRHVERELRSHISFCHPHVVRFRHLFLTDTHLAIVFEYCEGGDLYQYVSKKGSLQEDEARRFFQQLVIGIEYCHKMGVVNRDIKLENALLDGSLRLLKLTDFGYAKTDADSLPISQVGTPNYAAPEVISSAQKQYDGQKADTWSCGVLLYVMLFHKYPFERPDDPPGQAGFAKVVQRTIAVDYKIPSRPSISSGCRDMLSHLMVGQPDKRFGTDEIMRHRWFLEGLPLGWEKLNPDCLNMKMSAEEQSKKELWIKQIVEEAKEVPHPGGASYSPSPGGSMDATFEQAMLEETGGRSL